MKDDLRRLLSVPAAVRRDYKGFIVLAVPDDSGTYAGYCWRIIDWLRFGGDYSSPSKEDIFTYFNDKVDSFIRFRDSLKSLK